jgi:phosphoribosylformylglycinamidine synthase
MGFYKKDHVLRVFKAVKELQDRGEVENAAVVKSSGVASRVAAMCFGNRLGFEFSDKLSFNDLFSRKMGTIIVAIPNDSNAIDKVEMAGGKFIGTTTEFGVFSWNGAELDIDDALDAYEGKLERIFPTIADEANMPFEIKEFTTDKTFKAAPGVLKGAKPKVIIPVFPGTNCEIDTARAFERAGADAEVFVIRNRNQNDINESFTELAGKINGANIVMIPGGFSAGDEPEGSGKFITASFRNTGLSDAVSDLLQNRDGLMLGICNGFQALIKLGLVPYGEIRDMTADSPTLTFNNIGRHQNKYVATKIMSNNSPWLAGVKPGDVYEIPVSHGEGKFAASEELVAKLAANGQIATCYVDYTGAASDNTEFNPNGSICAIEGILSPDGRVFGKMGHSERYEADLTKNIPGIKDQKIFESGVAYFL